jgi:hypothetical protein
MTYNGDMPSFIRKSLAMVLAYIESLGRTVDEHLLITIV